MWSINSLIHRFAFKLEPDVPLGKNSKQKERLDSERQSIKQINKKKCNITQKQGILKKNLGNFTDTIN